MQEKAKKYLNFAVALVISIWIPLGSTTIVAITLSISLSPISLDSLGFMSDYTQTIGISMFGIIFGFLLFVSLIARIFTKNFWFIAPIIVCLGMLMISWLQISAMGPGNVDALIRKLLLEFIVLMFYCACAVFFYWIIRVLMDNIRIFKKIAYMFVAIMLIGMITSRFLINIDSFDTLIIMIKILSLSALGLSIILLVIIAIAFLFLAINKKRKFSYSARFWELF